MYLPTLDSGWGEATVNPESTRQVTEAPKGTSLTDCVPWVVFIDTVPLYCSSEG